MKTETDKIGMLDELIKCFDEITVADMRNPEIRDRFITIARIVNTALE